ncbi:MAG: ABC transporter ATP-binding protein [Candidatus Thorarchaeota archaeon]|nr:ABC transporter ATP-binding protein [Candidatus Thorarchaeota archaeon]
MSNLFALDHLRVVLPSSKGDLVLVDDASLELQPKECFGLLGESGCGKSSLLTAALGLFQITQRYKDAQIKKEWSFPVQLQYESKEIWNRTVSGHSFYRGIDLLSLNHSERARYLGSHISFMPQGLASALTPTISIGNQTGEPLAIHTPDIRSEKMKQRVFEYLDLVSLADSRDRYILDPSKFSGGEAQRVKLAMSLIAAPYLVIADEPTSALDVTVQRQVIGLFQMIKEEFDVALMIVSHDVGVIAELADRIGIMYAGRIVEVGSAEEIFHRPKHPYSIGLMASFPTIAMMRMAKGGEKPKLRGISGAPPNPREIPQGCGFHPRCPFASDICFTEKPSMSELEDNHLVACHLFAEDCRKHLPLLTG